MRVEFLSNREEVIQATIDTINVSSTDCMGMGRQIAWIERPNFKNALKLAINERNITVRVIGVREGEVKYFADQFEEIGAFVRYYPHGDVRVALADTNQAVLAFPLPCLGVHIDRRYVGILIEHEDFCHWIKLRFEEIWENSSKLSDSLWKLIKEDFFENPATIVAGLIGAILGAIATLITLVFK